MGDLRDSIQPLSIGEIADRSVTLTVQRWRTLLVLVLVEAVPFGIARAVLGSEEFVPAWFIPDVLLNVLLCAAAVLATVAPVGAAPAVQIRSAARRFGSALATFLLAGAWVVLWLGVTGIAAGLLTIPLVAFGVPLSPFFEFAVFGWIAALVFVPRAALVATTMLPILILEDVSPLGAFTRALRRVDHAGLRRSWLLGLAVLAVTLAPAAAISAAVDAVVNATHLTVLRAVEQLFEDAVSLGFGSVLGTVVALEMRARSEGTDLGIRVAESPLASSALGPHG